MDTGLIIGLAVGLAYGMWAFFNDKNLWRNKPREILEEMIQSADWKRIHTALGEVKRRGEDIRPYLPIVLKMLVAESRMQRTAGKITLQKLYPDIAHELPKFEGTAPRDVCIAKAKPVLERFGISI